MKPAILARALAILFALTLATGPVLAQDASGSGAQGDRQQQFAKRFGAANTSGDGKLTRDQAKSGMPYVYKHFDDIDTQKKGYVTVQDIAAYGAARRSAKQGGNGAPPQQ